PVNVYTAPNELWIAPPSLVAVLSRNVQASNACGGSNPGEPNWSAATAPPFSAALPANSTRAAVSVAPSVTRTAPPSAPGAPALSAAGSIVAVNTAGAVTGSSGSSRRAGLRIGVPGGVKDTPPPERPAGAVTDHRTGSPDVNERRTPAAGGRGRRGCYRRHV